MAGRQGRFVTPPLMLASARVDFRHIFRRILQLQLPALAESGFDPPVRVAIIDNLALCVVPKELPLVVGRHGAEHEPLGIRPSNAEVRASWGATFASAHPIARVCRSVLAGTRTW